MSLSGNAIGRRIRRDLVSSSRPFILSACALAISSGVGGAGGAAVAGIIGGGGVHTWDGSVNTSWQTAGNWNTNVVPGVADGVIINGGPSNVSLNGDSANLASLFVGGGRLLSNAGHNISVQSGVGTTTVNGAGSTLFITANGGGAYGLQSNTLTVQSNGRLQMSGGWAQIAQQLTLSSGGRITGHGDVYVSLSAPASFNAANGSDITVSGGDLELGIIGGGGSIALAPTINITEANRTLFINAPVFLPVEDINLGNNSAFDSEFNWILDGTLSANPGSGNMSHVEGDGSMTVNGVVSVSNNGALRILPQANFEPGSQTTLGMGSTLEIDGGYSVDAGHVTTIGPNAKLQLDGVPSIFGWDGDVVSTGGAIESNNALSLAIDGHLTLGSFGGLRSNLNGTSSIRASGSIDAPGLGAIVNGTFDVRSSASMSLDLASTLLIVNGDLILRTDSTTSGDGAIQVNADGGLRMQADANVSVDVVNGGDFEAGDNASRVQVDLNATFTQQATGRLNVDIGGPALPGCDHLAIWDDAVLAGTLNVRLAGGFAPAVGDQFTILTANSISGTFAAVTGAQGFSVSYTADEVVLTFDGNTLVGDVNGDGFVNVTDLLMVITAWGPCPPAPAVCPADVNDDGLVNVTDLLLVITNWT